MEKVTPTYTLDWYIKWVSSIFVIVAVLCRSIEEVPRVYDLCFSTLGTLGWLAVGLLWHDRAIIVLNAVILFVLSGGLIRYVL
jgi:hypothetical protein